jgi:hypothetical protein
MECLSPSSDGRATCTDDGQEDFIVQINATTIRIRPWFVAGTAFAAALWFLPATSAAQDLRRLEPGTTIAVRTNQMIEVDRQDHRVYTGVVDADVRDTNNRIVVPRGSAVELSVRVARDNELVLDLESIVTNGQRYAIDANSDRAESRREDDIIGTIVGAIKGGDSRGRTVRVPRDSVVSFRLQRPLDVGVADRGYDRNGSHYHGRDADRNDRHDDQHRDDDRNDRRDQPRDNDRR